MVNFYWTKHGPLKWALVYPKTNQLSQISAPVLGRLPLLDLPVPLLDRVPRGRDRIAGEAGRPLRPDLPLPGRRRVSRTREEEIAVAIPDPHLLLQGEPPLGHCGFLA